MVTPPISIYSTSLTGVPQLSGDVYGTVFYFNGPTYTSISAYDPNVKQVIWNFGDGNIAYDTLFPSHVYKFPGIYTVTLSAFGYDNTYSTNTASISVDYVYRDYISFANYPKQFGTPGEISPEPFTVNIISAQINEPIKVKLFAANSPSIPLDFATGKWKFLTPTWSFYDLSGNAIDTLNIETVNLYNKDGNVVAVSGSGQFKFRDDQSIGNPTENCPLVIIATLQTSALPVPLETNTYKYFSYSNTTVTRATIAWQFYDYKPDYFKVTGNYIDGISTSKWAGYPIPVLITGHSNLANRFCYTGVPTTSSGIIYNFPVDNPTGLSTVLNLDIIDQDGNIVPSVINVSATTPYTTDPDAIHFQRTDVNGFDTGGYVFTTITPAATATAENATIVAYTVPNENPYLAEWDFPYAGGYGPTPIAWISNAENKNLYQILSMPYPEGCTTIDIYKSNGTLIDTTITITDTPWVDTPGNTFNYGMSGYSGIYSISLFPGDHTVVAADAELDRLYRIDTTGTILCSVSLSSITGINNLTAGCTPAYTSIDRCGNTWITLFDTASVIKLDYHFNLSAIAAPSGIPINYTFDAPYNNFTGDELLRPSIVETDSNSNAWVTYTHPVCSLLVQYSPTGDVLNQINLGNTSTTLGIAINKKNQVWVMDEMHDTDFGGCFRLYGDPNVYYSKGSVKGYVNTKYTLLSTVSSGPPLTPTWFSRPNNMCLDKHNNIWFTHGIRNIGFIDRATAAVSSWYIPPKETYPTVYNNDLKLSYLDVSKAFLSFNNIDSSNNIFYYDNAGDDDFTNKELNPDFAKGYDEELGGIAVDPYNRLWVIDSKMNNVFLLSATPSLEKSIRPRYFKIQPWTSIGYLNNLENTFTYTQTAPPYKSAQATGDWTGNKWFQKYANFTDTISGASNNFNIYNFNKSFGLRRLNESFSTADYYKSLALPDILSQNDKLFDSYLGAMVGTAAPSGYEDIGQKTYERIANFVPNHSDVDTCNITQLMSLARSMDVSAINFSNVYPAEVQNMIDIASIPRTKLWGILDSTPLSSESINESMKYPLDVNTAFVTAGQRIYIQSIYDSRPVLNVVPVNTFLPEEHQQHYPLNLYPSFGLLQNISDPTKYRFYEYHPVYYPNPLLTLNTLYPNLTGAALYAKLSDVSFNERFIESVIDWNSPFTTINRTLSTADDLYADGGIIESMFSYYLTKNLIIN
jgi:hypothetical protein